MPRGRKRKAIARREPNGQPQRAPAVERDAARTAIEARQRVFSAPLEVARLPLMGSAVGRAYCAGAISGEHVGVARAYQTLRAQYLAAIAADGRPSDPRGDDPPAPCADCGRSVRCDDCYARWSQATRARLIAAEQIWTPWEMTVVSQVVTQDFDWPIQYGTLRQALDALWMHWGQPEAPVDVRGKSR